MSEFACGRERPDRSAPAAFGLQWAARSSLLCLLLLLSLVSERQGFSAEKRCLHVISYHRGYEWSDGIQKGLEENLKGICRLEVIEMDSYRNPTKLYAKEKGGEIAKQIHDMKPDLVFVSDDPAVAEVLTAHFKDAPIPFVFSGVNWTGDQYGLPFKNSTGMLEVLPIFGMIREVKKAIPGVKRVSFLSADTDSERREFVHISRAFKKQGIEVQSYWVKTFEQWKRAFVFAQDNDFVYFSSESGIQGWDKDEAMKFVKGQMRKLSAASQKWLLPFVAFAVVKLPEEQGEWSAEAAKRILRGAKPSDIPVAKNEKFQLWVNPELMVLSPAKLEAGTPKGAPSSSSSGRTGDRTH